MSTSDIYIYGGISTIANSMRLLSYGFNSKSATHPIRIPHKKEIFFAFLMRKNMARTVFHSLKLNKKVSA